MVPQHTDLLCLLVVFPLSLRLQKIIFFRFVSLTIAFFTSFRCGHYDAKRRKSIKKLFTVCYRRLLKIYDHLRIQSLMMIQSIFRSQMINLIDEREELNRLRSVYGFVCTNTYYSSPKLSG